MSQQGPRPLRVLVVDDCPDMRDSLRLLLALWGHVVDCAPGGRDAIRSAERQAPDVVLLDVVMPRMNGYEVAKRLRRMPELEAAYVIGMSGIGGPRVVRDALSAGMDQYFVKPLDLDELARTLLAAAQRLAVGAVETIDGGVAESH